MVAFFWAPKGLFWEYFLFFLVFLGFMVVLSGFLDGFGVVCSVVLDTLWRLLK